MSLFWGRTEDRAVSYQDVWGSGGDVDLLGSGDAALSLVPLFAAHRVLYDAISCTPLHIYRETANGHGERLPVQPPLLTEPPFGTPATWKGQAVAAMASDGNAIGFATVLDRLGRPEQVAWLPPGEVFIDDDGPLADAYWWQGRPLPIDRVVHIPWFVPAGRRRGLSPLKKFKLAFEAGAAAQRMSRDWFAGGAIPGGHLKNTQYALDKAQAADAKASFKAAVQARDVLVTGNDWDYSTIGVPADEARFIEQLKLTANQVAAIYGIAPEEIGGERGNPLTYSTLEQDDLRFNGRTARPWAVRFEEAITRIRPAREYAKFNLDANVRADLKTRMEAHEIAQRAGVETNDEARRTEDRPPMSDAERAQWMGVWHQQGQQGTQAREESR